MVCCFKLLISKSGNQKDGKTFSYSSIDLPDSIAF